MTKWKPLETRTDGRTTPPLSPRNNGKPPGIFYYPNLTCNKYSKMFENLHALFESPAPPTYPSALAIDIPHEQPPSGNPSRSAHGNNRPSLTASKRRTRYPLAGHIEPSLPGRLNTATKLPLRPLNAVTHHHPGPLTTATRHPHGLPVRRRTHPCYTGTPRNIQRRKPLPPPPLVFAAASVPLLTWREPDTTYERLPAPH
jgi:hypothetical protein